MVIEGILHTTTRLPLDGTNQRCGGRFSYLLMIIGMRIYIFSLLSAKVYPQIQQCPLLPLFKRKQFNKGSLCLPGILYVAVHYFPPLPPPLKKKKAIAATILGYCKQQRGFVYFGIVTPSVFLSPAIASSLYRRVELVLIYSHFKIKSSFFLQKNISFDTVYH
ncbi:unnamed protein product [Phytomonas sp. EM1]|nr:unnamed protein product [Phytomonas sp. EM1]|eukprot:CCW64535.1 unnamed protein product [Phytomonas sp. isolate EM1]